MAAMPEDVSLASQCLDFCQMLAGKSLSFSFSLSVGNNFSFSVESRGKGALSSPTQSCEMSQIWQIYDKVSDVVESGVRFASKILTPHRMH